MRLLVFVFSSWRCARSTRFMLRIVLCVFEICEFNILLACVGVIVVHLTAAIILTRLITPSTILQEALALARMHSRHRKMTAQSQTVSQPLDEAADRAGGGSLSRKHRNPPAGTSSAPRNCRRCEEQNPPTPQGAGGNQLSRDEHERRHQGNSQLAQSWLSYVHCTVWQQDPY